MQAVVQCVVLVAAVLGIAHGVESVSDSSSCAPGRVSEQRPWTSEGEASTYARCHVACVEKVCVGTRAYLVAITARKVVRVCAM